jgi:hypothetical protein
VTATIELYPEIAEEQAIATFVLHPEMLAHFPELEVGHFGSLKAGLVFHLIRNLEAAGSPINAANVLAQAEHEERLDALSEWNAAGGRTFVERVLADAPALTAPEAIERRIRAFVPVIIRAAAARNGEIEQGEEQLRTEHELDEFALRDAEPAADNLPAAGLTADDDFSPERLEREVIALAEEHEKRNPPPDPPPDPFAAEYKRALDDVKAKLDATSKDRRSPLFGTDAVELLREELPPTVWQVGGLITKGGTAIGAGEPKGGIKTWMLLEGAVAMATDTRFCGEFTVMPGRVVVFFAEDQKQAIRNRIRALLAGANRELAPGRLYLEPRGQFIDILKDEDLAWIVASVRSRGSFDLLVLDPLRDIHSGEEDKSDSMRDVMRRLRVLGELLGCTVWVSHHTPKVTKDTAKRRAGQNMRGSSAIHGSVDSGLYIEPREGDGTNVFRARVTSQVKAGRSAGVFDLELAIEDDANGEAVRATWTYSRGDAPTTGAPTTIAAIGAKAEKLAQQERDVREVIRLVQMLEGEGRYLSQTEIRDLHPCPVPVGQKARVKALKTALERGHIRTEAGRFRASGCPQPEGNSK